VRRALVAKGVPQSVGDRLVGAGVRPELIRRARSRISTATPDELLAVPRATGTPAQVRRERNLRARLRTFTARIDATIE
jgi:hypothetical protein